MRQLRLPLFAKVNLIRISVFFVLIVTILLVVGALYSLKQTSQVIDLIKAQNFAQAKKVASSAKVVPSLLSTITFKKSSTLEAWRLALESVEPLENFTIQLNYVGRNIFDQAQPEANLLALEKNWSKLLDQSKKIEEHMRKSIFLRNSEVLGPFSELNNLGTDLLKISHYLSSGKKQFLILLQNSEELRATGGFMGSYAKIGLDNGKISHLEIQDIYEPDGQFTGFVEAPPGANEYLSGGKGLRLPDSNWQPDFPTSAKAIATYFYFGHERDLDGIMTINVDLVEKILKIVGDIYLPDYGLTASADNLTDLAHADRNSFFAGSKQKVIFLESLFNNLKFKLTKLTNQQIQNIVHTFMLGLPKKEVQAFVFEPEIEEELKKLKLSGNLQRTASADFFLAQIESNVGINKANKKISRSTNIKLNSQTTLITTTFHNSDANSKEDYINYHRYYLDPTTNVREISYNNQLISKFDEGIIKTNNGETYKQIGVLMALPAGESGSLTISLSHPEICTDGECEVDVWKQSGLPPTPYSIELGEQQINFVLEQDELIKINQL